MLPSDYFPASTPSQFREILDGLILGAMLVYVMLTGVK